MYRRMATAAKEVCLSESMSLRKAMGVAMATVTITHRKRGPPIGLRPDCGCAEGRGGARGVWLVRRERRPRGVRERRRGGSST